MAKRSEECRTLEVPACHKDLPILRSWEVNSKKWSTNPSPSEVLAPFTVGWRIVGWILSVSQISADWGTATTGKRQEEAKAGTPLRAGQHKLKRVTCGLQTGLLMLEYYTRRIVAVRFCDPNRFRQLLKQTGDKPLIRRVISIPNPSFVFGNATGGTIGICIQRIKTNIDGVLNAAKNVQLLSDGDALNIIQSFPYNLNLLNVSGVQYLRFKGYFKSGGVINPGEIQIFNTCTHVRCDGQAEISRGMDIADRKKAKCVFCLEDDSAQDIRHEMARISGALPFTIQCTEPKVENMETVDCEIRGFHLLATTINTTVEELHAQQLDEDTLAEHVLTNIGRKEVEIIGWQWVKTTEEDDYEEGKINLTIGATKKGIVHVVDITILEISTQQEG